MSSVMGGSPSFNSLRLESELLDDPLRLEPSHDSRHYLRSKLQWLRHIADCNKDNKKIPTMGEFYYCPRHCRLLCAAIRDSVTHSCNDELLDCGACLPGDECLTLRTELPIEFENCASARQRWHQSYKHLLDLQRDRELFNSSSNNEQKQKVYDRLRTIDKAQVTERLSWLAYDWSIWDACVPLRSVCQNNCNGVTKIDDKFKKLMRLKIRDSTDRGIEQLSERNKTWCFEHDCSGDAWPWRKLQNYDPDCGICYERSPSPRMQPQDDPNDDLNVLSSMLQKHAKVAD